MLSQATRAFKDHGGGFLCICSCAQPAAHCAAVLVRGVANGSAGASECECRTAASARGRQGHTSCAGLPDADAEMPFVTCRALLHCQSSLLPPLPLPLPLPSDGCQRYGMSSSSSEDEPTSIGCASCVGGSAKAESVRGAGPLLAAPSGASDRSMRSPRLLHITRHRTLDAEVALLMSLLHKDRLSSGQQNMHVGPHAVACSHSMGAHDRGWGHNAHESGGLSAYCGGRLLSVLRAKCSIASLRRTPHAVRMICLQSWNHCASMVTGRS